MWVFFRQSTAALAYSKAGRAYDKALSAVSFIFWAASEASLVLISS